MACQSQGFISTRSLCVFDKITLFGEPLLSKKSLAISRSLLVLFGTRLLCGSHCLFVFVVLLSTICELVRFKDQTKSILLSKNNIPLGTKIVNAKASSHVAFLRFGT